MSDKPVVCYRCHRCGETFGGEYGALTAHRKDCRKPVDLSLRAKEISARYNGWHRRGFSVRAKDRRALERLTGPWAELLPMMDERNAEFIRLAYGVDVPQLSAHDAAWFVFDDRSTAGHFERALTDLFMVAANRTEPPTVWLRSPLTGCLTNAQR